MTDKPDHIEQWAGCDGNDPKPRLARRIPIGGLPMNVSSTDGLDPGLGKKTGSIRHVPNENDDGQ